MSRCCRSVGRRSRGERAGLIQAFAPDGLQAMPFSISGRRHEGGTKVTRIAAQKI
jgi:hypothetical protein